MRKLILVTLLSLSACVVRARPVEYTDAEIVTVAPPAERVEIITPAPSPNHVWIRGHWGWQGGRHIWVGGFWELRRPGQVWVDGHWVAHRHGWVWVGGRWARA